MAHENPKIKVFTVRDADIYFQDSGKKWVKSGYKSPMGTTITGEVIKNEIIAFKPGNRPGANLQAVRLSDVKKYPQQNSHSADGEWGAFETLEITNRIVEDMWALEAKLRKTQIAFAITGVAFGIALSFVIFK